MACSSKLDDGTGIDDNILLLDDITLSDDSIVCNSLVKSACVLSPNFKGRFCFLGPGRLEDSEVSLRGLDAFLPPIYACILMV